MILCYDSETHRVQRVTPNNIIIINESLHQKRQRNKKLNTIKQKALFKRTYRN